MNSADDLALLLEQSRLAAEANAISRGKDCAAAEEVAFSICAAMQRAGVWSGDVDANYVDRYARGEMTLDALAHYLAGRQ